MANMSTDPSISNATIPVAGHEDREPTSGELWAGFVAGIGAVLGFGALFYKPLLMGTVAILLCVLGSLGDGQPSRIAKITLPIACICFLLGMLMSVFVTHMALW
ncbi:MAG: hypothetical protein JWM90_2309 [Thermoleophilia bacterium]|nr:hypothetical protein [Thermoleophilia bacterium]